MKLAKLNQTKVNEFSLLLTFKVQFRERMGVVLFRGSKFNGFSSYFSAHLSPRCLQSSLVSGTGLVERPLLWRGAAADLVSVAVSPEP